MFSFVSSHTSALSTYFISQLHLRKDSPPPPSRSLILVALQKECRADLSTEPVPSCCLISSASDSVLNYCSFIETFGLNNSSPPPQACKVWCNQTAWLRLSHTSDRWIKRMWFLLNSLLWREAENRCSGTTAWPPWDWFSTEQAILT